MSHEDVGSGFDPGAAGHELQGRARAPEKSAEVAPAVVGVMAALKEARRWLYVYATDPRRKDIDPLEVVRLCDEAIAALEAMLTPAEDPGPKPKPPPSPSALFRAGFEYGALAKDCELRPEAWEGRDPPPPDFPASWALVRAQIAAAR